MCSNFYRTITHLPAHEGHTRAIDIPFARIHNSYIINIKHLDKIKDNHVFIANKQIPISEKFKESFMALIQEKIF